MSKEQRDTNRWFLSDRIRLQIDWRNTDQNRGLPPPPLEKPIPETAETIQLPEWKSLLNLEKTTLVQAMSRRESRRNFSQSPISLQELSFLLWSTQGVRRLMGHHSALRTVPSAGCRHSFETYLAGLNIKDLHPGLYRYLPLSHRLAQLEKIPDLSSRLINATLGQTFCGRCAVTFIWTTVAYRMEWRYDLAAHRIIPIDMGHVGQNLYLACEAIQAGTCTVGAYDQDAMDQLIGVDGHDEFTLYLAPVGKIDLD